MLRCDLLAHLALFGVSALGYLKLLERWVRLPPAPTVGAVGARTTQSWRVEAVLCR